MYVIYDDLTNLIIRFSEFYQSDFDTKKKINGVLIDVHERCMPVSSEVWDNKNDYIGTNINEL